jgi:extradiol dioxygenase family protein
VADVLGLPEPSSFGPFAVVELHNGVSLDFMDAPEVTMQHNAFLIGEDEFDAVAARLRERDVPVYADPGHTRPGHNTNDGGRGLYFDSPDGHNLEVLTKPYGSGG